VASFQRTTIISAVLYLCVLTFLTGTNPLSPPALSLQIPIATVPTLKTGFTTGSQFRVHGSPGLRGPVHPMAEGRGQDKLPWEDEKVG